MLILFALVSDVILEHVVFITDIACAVCVFSVTEVANSYATGKLMLANNC